MAFYNLCLAGLLIVLLGMQLQSLAVPKVKKTTTLYRLPVAAIFLAMLFGVLLQDLLFDYGATDWRNGAKYYIIGFKTKAPFNMYVDAVTGLAVAALLANIAMHRSVYDFASLLPAAAMFFIDATHLKPAVEGLTTLTATTTTLEKLYVECPVGARLCLPCTPSTPCPPPPGTDRVPSSSFGHRPPVLHRPPPFPTGPPRCPLGTARCWLAPC